MTARQRYLVAGQKHYNQRSRSERNHISRPCQGEGDRETVEGSSAAGTVVKEAPVKVKLKQRRREPISYLINSLTAESVFYRQYESFPRPWTPVWKLFLDRGPLRRLRRHLPLTGEACAVIALRAIFLFPSIKNVGVLTLRHSFIHLLCVRILYSVCAVLVYYHSALQRAVH